MISWLKNWLLTKLENGIIPTEVVSVSKDGHVFLGKEKISKEEALQLKEEAHILEESRVWKLMQNTVKAQAIDKGMHSSTNWEQVLSAKMMLHNLGVQQNILNMIKKIKVL